MTYAIMASAFMPSLSKTNKPSPILRFTVYIGLNIATGLLAAVALTYIPNFSPFLIFLPTIAFCAMTGGFMVGFVTTVISLLSITIMLFYPANHPLLIADVSLFIQTCIFFLLGLFISYIIHSSSQQDKIIEYQRRLRQVHHLIETLEKNYENAQSEITARDQFLAIASHELKTPVTSMLLQVQTAIHNIRNVSLANFSVATLLKMLEDTEAQSKRLSKMVNDLLDLSLITTGKVDLEMEQADMSEIVRTVAERFTERLSNKKQIVILIKKPVTGYFDKLRIEQAIVNLISNAIKYGNNKPISIAVTGNTDRGRIVVKDHGIGIAADQQKKIFKRFERAVSPRDYKGLGVGLYITYQIIKAHNGKIHVESKVNKGSSFTIELPLRLMKK
jgi:signal transduction histidine kinase